MKTLIVLLALLGAANVWGDAVYPATTPDRYLGAQQGNTGSCAAVLSRKRTSMRFTLAAERNL